MVVKKPLGIAIIGYGMVGKFHHRALQGNEQFTVTGILNRSPVDPLFPVHQYQSYEEVLADPKVDVVDICLPSKLHAEYGCQAAQAGKHLVVEKPIATSMEDARRLAVTCREQDVFLAGIFQNRYTPAAAKVKKALEENILGKIYLGEATVKWARDAKYYSAPGRGTKASDGGGALINQAIHTIDLLLWFLGDVKSVQGITRTVRHNIEVEDLAVAIVEFQSGALGTITGSTALKPGYPERIEIFGEHGSIAWESGKVVRWDVDGYDKEDYLDTVQVGSGSSDAGGIPLENHQAQFRAIGEALLAGEQPPVAGEKASKALELILQIYKANES